MSNQAGRAPLPLATAGCHTPLMTEPLTADQAERLAPAFKALGDPTRLRLLSLIASHEGDEACVCDLTDAFDVSAPTISHHLKALRQRGLVTAERRATWVYYRAERPALDLLATVLAIPRQAGT